MALTLPDFQSTFKKFGKLIYMSGMTPPMITSLRKAHMGLVDQQASGLPEEFELNQEVISALGANVKQLNDSLSRFPSQCKTAADTYLKKYVAIDLGLPQNSSVNSIQAALTSQMATVSATVAPSGVIWSYFNNSLGINLPMAANSGSATIPDTYVDDDPL